MPRSKAARRASPPAAYKDVLSREIANILERRQLTQTAAARIIRDAPSQLSLIVNGRLRGFSVERLLRIVARLGKDVEIQIRKSKRGPGRIRVVSRA